MDLEYFHVILKKKKNNFIVSVLKLKKGGKKLLFSKSCGMLEGIQGSKKFTTVAVETLGRKSFVRIFWEGFKNVKVDFILKFKLNKFVRSFLKGFWSYGKYYGKLYLQSQLIITHNGVRSRKLRRV